MRGDVPPARLFRMGLTVLVPYVVSTLSSVGALREIGNNPSNSNVSTPLKRHP